jgi:hypothetical protein
MPQRLAVARDDIDSGKIRPRLQDGSREFLPQCEIEITDIFQSARSSGSSQLQDPTAEIRRDRNLAIGENLDTDVPL